MRGALIHRAIVSRNVATGTNAWNRPAAPDYQPNGEVLPCRAWSRTKRHVRDDGKEAVIEDMRAAFMPDADVQVGDQLAVRDRRGNVLFQGPVSVETLTTRGANVRHREATLTRHR